MAKLPEPQGDLTKRDLALDAARSYSMLIVVAAHFLMIIMRWNPNGTVWTDNTLTSGRPWPYVTWLLQIMPLFFIAGGAVNAGSWERMHGRYNEWLWRRVNRLLKPTLVFLLILAPIFTVITFLVSRNITDPLAQGITGPLWFLAVYIPVTALTPFTLKWWQRSGKSTLLLMAAVAFVVDLLRFQMGDYIGLINFYGLWVFVHQLGYWYRDGVSRKEGASLLAFGLGGMILLSQVLRWYPTSMVGLANEPFSNMAPPTIMLVFHSLSMFGGFVLVAPALQRFFSSPKGLRRLTHAGTLTMSIYLWHQSVIAICIAFMHVIGRDMPVKLIQQDGYTWHTMLTTINVPSYRLIIPAGPEYWLQLIPYGLVVGTGVYWLARTVWPFEFVRLPWFDSASVHVSISGPRAFAGVLLASVGLLFISAASMSGFPFAMHSYAGVPTNAALALLMIIGGVALLRQPSQAKQST